MLAACPQESRSLCWTGATARRVSVAGQCLLTILSSQLHQLDLLPLWEENKEKQNKTTKKQNSRRK